MIHKSQQYNTKYYHTYQYHAHTIWCTAVICVFLLLVLLAVCTNDSIVLCAMSGSCCAVYTSELCVVVLMHKLRALLYVLKCRPVCFLVFVLMVLSAFLLFFVQLSWIMFLHYSLCCSTNRRLMSHLYVLCAAVLVYYFIMLLIIIDSVY